MPYDAESGLHFTWQFDPETGKHFRLFTEGLAETADWPDDDDVPVIAVNAADEDDEPGCA